MERKETNETVAYNVGTSNYSRLAVQPWYMWEMLRLNPWDADIQKRLIRTKMEPGKTWREARIEDYEKIKHICDHRIGMLRNSRYDDREEAIYRFVSRYGEDRLMQLLNGYTEEQESGELDDSIITSIRRGDRFLCIKSVFRPPLNEVAYWKDRIYISQQDGCITDELGNMEYVSKMKGANKYFRKVNPKDCTDHEDKETDQDKGEGK